MNTEELTKKYQEKYFADCNLFTLLEVRAINFDPHPYTIGPKHVAHAADKYNGILGTETLKEVKCALPGCDLSYDDHKYDTVMMLKLKRNATKDETMEFLQTLKDEMINDSIDGFVMVETPEKYRFLDDTTENG